MESTLFKCHGLEWRSCHIGATSLCVRRDSVAPSFYTLQLGTIELIATRERTDELAGTVSVAASSILSRSLLLNKNATLAVHSSRKQAVGQELVHHVPHLAIIKTVNQDVIFTAWTPADDLGNSNLREQGFNYIGRRISGWFDIGPAMKYPEGFTGSTLEISGTKNVYDSWNFDAQKYWNKKTDLGLFRNKFRVSVRKWTKFEACDTKAIEVCAYCALTTSSK